MKKKEIPQHRREKGITFTKFTDDEIGIILYLYENNIEMTDIANHFGKAPSSIYRIVVKNECKRKSIENLLQELEEVCS